MNVGGADLSGAQTWLCGLPYSVRLCDVSDYLCIDDTRLSDIRRALQESQDLIRTLDDGNDDERYIAKATLYRWFAGLNIRLSRVGVHALSERQLLSKMNSLRLDGTWSHPPPEYIGLGESCGLVGHLESQDRYNFPISTVMSFLSPLNAEAAEGYLLDTPYDTGTTGRFEQSIVGQLRGALAALCESREQYVTLRRHGMLGCEAMTLEEIGQLLGCTRERVRQIEARCWKRIQQHGFRRRLAPLLVMYVANRGGSLLISSSNIRPEVEFICKCLGVPLWSFPSVGVRMIGEGVDSISLPEDLWSDLVNLNANLKRFISLLPLQLTQADVEEIAAPYMPIVVRRLTKTQKGYLVLKEIGRPAHFSEIADMYAQMFPGECANEHAIHGALLRCEHGIVWIGAKGVFALEEWGYERPKSTLMDTIAEIVTEKYQSTGNPVPFLVIQAEIGKHRRVVNPSSLILGSCYNPKLESVGDFCFIPREETDAEAEEVADEDLDRALREFEQKTGAR